MSLEQEHEVFGRLMQICTMYGYNPAYFHRLNIKHDPECICGHLIPPNPSRRFWNHILLNCDVYKEHCHILSAISPQHQHHASILLGSTKGLLAMVRFLKESGAFTAMGKPYKPSTTSTLPGQKLHNLESYESP